MWSLCNYIYDKIFSKKTVGQKRKYEEGIEYPPLKQIKLENRNYFESEERSYNFVNNMKKGENIFDENDECCIVHEVFPKKWGNSSTMARQSIHKSSYGLRSSASLDKRKYETNFNSHISKQPICQSSHLGAAEVVRYVNKNSTQNCGKPVKNKTPSTRIFNSYRTFNGRQNLDKLRPSFQSSMKKSLNFLQQSYRLSEKVQYMQLLQQQLTKLDSFLAPFTIQPIGCQKGRKSSIPLIDLTKEKSTVVVDRSRENIPWTSSKIKSDDNSSSSSLHPEQKEVCTVNTLQDILKTHPVTEKNIVEEILLHHSSETAEKRRQAEVEAAKLKILNATNRKAYSDALEEKLRQYMRITTPAIEEIEPEKEKYVLPELTQDQESKVYSALIPSPASEVLVEKFALQIKRRDLQTLKGLNWLNDEVINFYMNLIMERGNQENLPKVYAFNTFFYPKLISSGHASLKRWTKKVDIFSHDMILVPIHLGMHWCMAVIDFRTKEVKYYDSMGSPNNRCLQALLLYLEAESMDKKKVPYDTNDWKQINVEDIPQQMNGSDCGVFSCMFAEHLARDSPLLFSQDHMPYFRRKMVCEIIEAKLIT